MPITDLTGYQWVANSRLSIGPVDVATYNLSGNWQFDNGGGVFSGDFAQLRLVLPDPEMPVSNLDLYHNGTWASVWSFSSWNGPTPATMTITGGTDATNSTLIAWLQANGTLTAPIQANTYTLTHTLTNLSKGNITLQITPDTNYTYPTSLTISNGTIVSYDNTTGIAVISGDDTTVVSGECVIPAPAYTWACTVSNLGSSSPSSVSFTDDGTMPTFEEQTIGSDVFIKIPTMYRKVNSVADSQITSFTIADGKVDNDYQPYPCFLDESGNLLDYVLVGKYWISSTTTANSVNATATTMTIGNGRTLCRAKTNSNYVGQLYDWQIHQLWRDLIICFKETVNTNSGTAWTTDELGIYWGTSGCWIDGLTNNNGALAVSYKPSAYVDNATSSTTDYVAVGYNMPTSSSSYNITKLGYDSNNPFVNMPTTASGSSYTTYYCDGFYGSSNNTPFVAYVGAANADSGAFSSDFHADWPFKRACRLCLRPIA